jgi:hypothetical protein
LSLLRTLGAPEGGPGDLRPRALEIPPDLAALPLWTEWSWQCRLHGLFAALVLAPSGQHRNRSRARGPQARPAAEFPGARRPGSNLIGQTRRDRHPRAAGKSMRRCQSRGPAYV